MALHRPFLTGLKRKTSNFALYARVLAVFAVFIVILLGRTDIETIRSKLATIYIMITSPLTMLDELIGHKYHATIQKLNRENIELNRKLNELRYIQVENKKLRIESRYVAPNGFRSIIAKAFMNVEGDWQKSIFINAGKADGVEKFSTVMNSSGLIGMVTEVGEHWSRVLVALNRLFKVPVMMPRSDVEAILSGNNKDLHFEILSQDKKLADNDEILTSGRCGYFPPGIKVGQIVNGKIIASVDLKMVDYVVVITREKSSNTTSNITENVSHTTEVNPEKPTSQEKTQKGQETPTAKNTVVPVEGLEPPRP